MYRRKRVYRKSSRRPYTKKRSVVGKRKSSVSVAVKKYVNKTIHKNMENKVVVESLTVDFAAYLANIDLAVQAISPTPSTLAIPVGPEQGQRIGNTIRTRKLVLKYIIHPNPQDDTTQPQPIPQEVTVWIGYLKNNRMKQPDISDYNVFFQNGSNTQAPTSTLYDMLLPENQDVFHICKKIRHKIGNSVYTDYQGIKPFNYYSSNDFKLNVMRSVDCTKYINKVLKFNDQSVNPDTGLYMWMTSVNADGTTSYQAKVVRMSYTLRYEYEDA